MSSASENEFAPCPFCGARLTVSTRSQGEPNTYRHPGTSCVISGSNLGVEYLRERGWNRRHGFHYEVVDGVPELNSQGRGHPATQQDLNKFFAWLGEKAGLERG